ncbi:hypothetical protein [Brevundimonas sp.]|uniref:hypothetical protein n=1 Tax=Brevundimonas sp. TaxID=1871086 RepID=UPI0025EDD6A4|nr:hypothetical protein [Brevundimonas sp.]
MPGVRDLKALVARPEARRWLAGLAVVAICHLVVLTLVVPTARTGRTQIDGRPIPPIFVDITPRARPARAPPMTAEGAAGRPSPAPPVAVRQAESSDAPALVSPLLVETAPLAPSRPGRVIPRSWRERCGLPADGPVSDADWAACRQLFMDAAAPPPGPPRRRGAPAQDFAAQGAARIAAYEAQRAPTPVGGGLARPSSTPGSNFGMGAMDDSVIYVQGSRPRTGAEED